ncbi:alanine--tRNA ligase [Microbulbifer thermotolerans]|uniref:alanine--tRNA ligase n=1 Tax=Microbulbifer thermotolerans TaxID=252514 RepID=UPI0022490C84|nr:alanine--tRNA ligase [Microbulbifer thermotolerans]MCX2794880.1 alanine--tRNA ligase [Microbulbifer thermotolerans]MCX2835835.1 alanine--tRNA ligase [Microbulbifer thermotolerans]
MKSAQIRDAFLKYFAEQGHTVVPSSSLVPGNDPTLLFTNAGMVQFKDTFLGQEQRPYSRAVSAQRCVRAGGKHNDLENVGYTARHHTFFEMLGNFSFGDYFKREAIQFAWEFLTKVLKLPEERLWVTVHISDDEAAGIWLKEVGVSAERFSRLDEDNFWQMGDTGPCGPCSEIFYDHGPEVPGGPPGSDNDDLDRYIEIWNLVFMQYERTADGELHPLPKPSVDTGMGLERIAAVMQGVHSNYEIDLFQALLKAAGDIVGCSDMEEKSLRVIADHIRSCSFLIADGVMPSNEGRGFVLRRIIRRAVRHGHKLGHKEIFFYRLVEALVEQMGDAYPELRERRETIESALRKEEEQFARTLDKGMALLEEALESLQGDEIPGELVFTLHDTYGFPTDLTQDIARERGLTLDMAGYEAAMEAQRERARAAGKFKQDYSGALELEGATEFLGYETTRAEGKVIALVKGGEQVERLEEGDEGTVVLDRTPFYAESGGQVGDCGYLNNGSSRFEVRDCAKQGAHHLHEGRVLAGAIAVGDSVSAEVSADVRQATALNHSATHLLHAALRKVLGEHVTQKGSLVDSERLRFDFSHPEAVTAKQLHAIESLVNKQIRANTAVHVEETDLESAKRKGAMALFGEKYGDKVRVLSMGAIDDGSAFSVELCGGTHVRRTGDIGLLRIVSESGIASGQRRIEAVTGAHALALFDETQQRLEHVAALLKTRPDKLADKVEQLLANNRKLEKEVAQLKTKLISGSGGDLSSQAVEVAGIKLLAASVDGADPKSLRDLADQMKSKLGSAVVLLAAPAEEKVALVAAVTKDLTARISAGDLMRFAAAKLGGKGGGRPDMAQGGGTDVAALPAVLKEVPGWVEGQLN